MRAAIAELAPRLEPSGIVSTTMNSLVSSLGMKSLPMRWPSGTTIATVASDSATTSQRQFSDQRTSHA
ncbi:hypothetical protein OV203_31190 [Nannocystis sp. ILAH1]|uniref:hypothetical protein n=1 Tax=Nannocystis sp. ILAH1 TaxID=2996789 RepID=UPI002270FF0A|nr:hypothetical protein [Nannocystis sp. ILAH1]MCY0991649.1 hypothetical protein [Nannocystis sp. ILAH1]